jgi:serine/threonine protein kinase
MKLENCFLDKNMQVKVADFGLAARFEDGVKLRKKVGSAGKMAPELFSGASYEGPPVDVFACGVMLFEMLTGEIPFNESLDSGYKMFMSDAEKSL